MGRTNPTLIIITIISTTININHHLIIRFQPKPLKQYAPVTRKSCDKPARTANSKNCRVHLNRKAIIANMSRLGLIVLTIRPEILEWAD